MYRLAGDQSSAASLRVWLLAYHKGHENVVGRYVCVLLVPLMAKCGCLQGGAMLDGIRRIGCSKSAHARHAAVGVCRPCHDMQLWDPAGGPLPAVLLCEGITGGSCSEAARVTLQRDTAV